MGYVVQTPILNAEHHNPHTHNLHTLPLQDNILQEPCQSQVDRDSVGDLEEDFLVDSLNKAVEEDFQVDSLNKAAEEDFREVFLEEPVADSQAQAEGNPADFLALAEGDPADFQEELGVILHKVDLEEVIPHNKAVEEVPQEVIPLKVVPQEEDSHNKPHLHPHPHLPQLLLQLPPLHPHLHHNLPHLWEDLNLHKMLDTANAELDEML